MKAIMTLSIVLMFGVIAQAQSENLKNQILKKAPSAKATSIIKKSFVRSRANTPVYVLLSKFKNTRVKKALLFTPHNNKPKMA